MRITLVVPGLLSLPPDALARDATLSRIAAIASPVVESDLASAVLADVGLDVSPAPLAALGAGIDVGTRWATRADPVSIVVGRDDARLEGLVVDLTDAERETLLALLNAHFAGDALTFVAPRADAWFALSEVPQSFSTVAPERAVGVGLRSLMPAGRDAGRWRQWLTETQMLLHDHPLSGRVRPVTSLWFSGGGSLPSPATVPTVHGHATADRAGDLVRGLARMRGVEVNASADVRQLLATDTFDVAMLSTASVDREDRLSAFAREILAPSLDALDRSIASSLKLIADGRGGAASWDAHRTSWFRRVTRRRAAFARPQ